MANIPKEVNVDSLEVLDRAKMIQNGVDSVITSFNAFFMNGRLM